MTTVCQVGVAVQQEGIEYIGMRNEQAACYAAQVRDFYGIEKLSSAIKPVLSPLYLANIG